MKKGSHTEYKWSYLSRPGLEKFQKMVLDRFELFLAICCNGLLVLNTDVLISPREKRHNLFPKLIDGCFTGYEGMPGQMKLRSQLKEKFFELANNTAVHCDSDFSPLTPEFIARHLVQTLAKRGNRFQEFSPLYAPLESEESISIQLADMIVGALKTKIEGGESLSPPLERLFFDKRKIRASKDKMLQAYYWLP